MALLEDLRQFAEQAKKRQAVVRGEEATKQALVLPFLQLLGYDIYDPAELQPEYGADFSRGRKGSQSEKVDYAVHLNGSLAFFIECKAVDAVLENHDAQLARYFNSVPSVRVGILTNGLVYRFFTDLHEPNIMDAEPFFEFQVTSFAERDVEALRPFTKETFDAEAVQNHAEELVFIDKVTVLVNDLLRSPTESFVRFLLGELDLVPGRVTARIVERFIPIVKKSIETTLVDMMTKSLKHEMKQQATQSATVAAAAPPVAKVAEGQIAQGSTPTPDESEDALETAEELAIFETVRKICSESSVKHDIACKDVRKYFGINLGKVSWWFLRVYMQSKRKLIVTRLPVEQATLLAPGFETDATPPGIRGASRVYYNSVDDISKLRSLILVAYEDEVKRHQAGAPAELEDVFDDPAGAG